MAAALLTGASATAAVVDPEVRVVIRTYDASRTEDTLPSARAVAGAILEEAGVSVTWMSCDAVFVGRVGHPCLAPLAKHELSVRFVRLPPHQGQLRLLALGNSLVDTHHRLGSLATIYLDRVERLAGRWRVDVGTLLGRAVAHEIGHLLLGSSAHAAAGVMRAEWSQHALRSERPGDWAFTSSDAQSIREAVRLRKARQMAAGRIGD